MKLRVILVAVLLCLPLLSFADVLSISGTVVLTPTTDTFACSSGPCAAGYGSATVAGSTGAFSSLNGSTAGIHNLNDSIQPLNQAFSLPNFLTLPLGSDLALDLTFRPLGTFTSATCGGAPAPGQTCTPTIPALVSPSNPLGKSDFNLTNTGLNAMTLSFEADGTFREISTGNTSPFAGLFTAQIAGESFQQLLTDWAAGGSLTTTYSVAFTGDYPGSTAPQVPEPASLLMLGTGMAAVVERLRRKRS